MTMPASVGPMIIPTCQTSWARAAAAGRVSRRTSRGMMALRVCMSAPANPADKAPKTNSGQRAGWSSPALSASTALVTISRTWLTSRSRRRSKASDRAPPASEKMMSGPSEASPTKPTASDEWVMPNTWMGMATTVNWRPMYDAT